MSEPIIQVGSGARIYVAVVLFFEMAGASFDLKRYEFSRRLIVVNALYVRVYTLINNQLFAEYPAKLLNYNSLDGIHADTFR